LAKKIGPLAKSINKNAEEELLLLTANLQADLEQYEKSIETRNKLLASNKEYWNDSDVLLSQGFTFLNFGMYQQALDFFAMTEYNNFKQKDLRENLRLWLLIGQAQCHSRLG